MQTGFDVPAEIGMAEAEIATPALIVDLDAFEANLATMRRRAESLGVALRAHAKTHKSADIALAQMARGGAVGVCVQKASEALALARAGVGDILVANEVRGARRAAMLAEAAKIARIAVCIDDPTAVAALSAAALSAGVELGALVELEAGGGRCGAEPGAPAVEIARAILAAPGLCFEGIQCYCGPAQHIYEPAARRARIDAAIAQARATRDALLEAGLPCPKVTGAGTGSFEFEGASGVYSELQCGSYVFMDADYARVRDDAGAPPPFAHSLFVLAEVMSASRPGRAICDAGLKVMSFDSGLPRVHGLDGVEYLGASDEHGALADPDGRLKIGDRLRLIPGHCDPTCNLHDWYVAVRGGKVEALWPVTARGKHF